jgi:hypothetical protein
MPACPNCGRQTLRTKDWACQWCGYPLISRAFKKIDKTFKELQEERNPTLKSAEAEPELEIKPAPKPIFRPAPKPEPEPERKFSPPARPAARPEPEPEPEPERRLIAAPQPEPEPVPAPEPRQEINLEPEPPPEPPIKLESISDGMEITADQIDALFRANKSGAHTEFAGKTLVVRGIVEKVFIREHLEIRYIMLTGTGRRMLWSSRCTFNKEEASKLSGVNEGEAVAVRGKYYGYSKNIMFKDCVLV